MEKYIISKDNIDSIVWKNTSNAIDIVIDDTVEELPKGFFKGIFSIFSITVGKNLRDLSPIHFGEAPPTIDYITIDKENKHIYSKDDNCVYKQILNGSEKELTLVLGCSHSDITEPIDCIGYAAFRSQILDDELIIPSSCTRLENECFAFAELSEISLPDKLQFIPTQAFEHCIFLNYVKLPKNLKRIGKKAFLNTDIHHIEFPENLEIIENEAFFKSSIEKAIFNSKLRSIGTSAFKDTHLAKVVFSDSIQNIGAGAFANTKLKELTLPENKSFKRIENFTFSGIRKLESVHIPANIRKMGNKVFEKCKNLKNISFGSSDIDFNSTVFEETQFRDTLKEPLILGKRFIYAPPHSIPPVYRIPDEVTEIKEFAFLFKDDLSEIDTNNVTKIFSYAFWDSSLEKINLRNVEELLGGRTFVQCKKLKEIKFGKSSIKKIDGPICFGCEKLNKVVIPATDVPIRSSLFVYCKDIETLEFLPNTKVQANPVLKATSVNNLILPSVSKFFGNPFFFQIVKHVSTDSIKEFEKNNPMLFRYFTPIMGLKSIDEIIDSGKSLHEINNELKNFYLSGNR